MKKAAKGGMHVPSIKGDKMAHSDHHAANKEYDMDDGFSPDEGYQNPGSTHHLGKNVASED
jgi:hypothetical protein